MTASNPLLDSEKFERSTVVKGELNTLLSDTRYELVILNNSESYSKVPKRQDSLCWWCCEIAHVGRRFGESLGGSRIRIAKRRHRPISSRHHFTSSQLFSNFEVNTANMANDEYDVSSLTVYDVLCNSANLCESSSSSRVGIP